ncbi:hypothetical protein J3R30DRAFT_3706063 [Lentinula aciculospora]|uniref:Uncharacterized protein n=1 Tax=Lentinula aciculospora TaxID=153920 RepID=A0A9W9A6B9_9AGAR|nr:hypothetical protein J3R30DRAFT_3706063 [Lentinula aciculospora]
MKFFTTVTLVGYFSIASVLAVDLRREVYTLSVFCDAWSKECAIIANATGDAYSYCEPGYDGAGTASADCFTYDGTTITDYTQSVISSLNAIEFA